MIMTDRIAWLRWSLAVVLGAGAASLLVAVASARHEGIGAVVGTALGAAELVAVVLLLVRSTRRAGGVLVLAVLAAATVVHAHAGQAPPLSFLVYAVATLVVMQPERA